MDMKAPADDLGAYLEVLRGLSFVRAATLRAAPDGSPADATLVIRTPTETIRLPARQTRSLLGRDVAEHLAGLAQRLPGLLLLTPAVGRHLGDFLAEHGVNFVDLAGNCSLRLGDRYQARIQGRPRSSARTTEKAWRAVTRLLAAKATSIRKIAIEERLSYGWAHATVKRLVEAGIARQRGSVVEMADVEALLNAVAWERPFEDLSMGAIKTSYDSLSDAVEALSRSASEWKMQLAFCGLTAATTYSGYGAMHDAAYCYICDKERLEIMKSGLTGNGVTIRFYKPDRDVFARAKTRDGVLLVSEGQALLDVAGMGYVAKDVALDMARRYAEIAADSH